MADYLLPLLLIAGVRGMDIRTPSSVIVALEGGEKKLGCLFTSCYKVDPKLFNLQWTSICSNCSDELIIAKYDKSLWLASEGPFGGRVKWLGNLASMDVSIELSGLSQSDAGTYTCQVMNPPDRDTGIMTIELQIVKELPPLQSSRAGVIVGSVVGCVAAIAVVGLALLLCLRRRKAEPPIGEGTDATPDAPL
uniref:Sodium channel, voltage-gated, type II, beta n=1 Tax=Eptatretus burgeri TaxID=7764 RepID=A0A8C4NB08_EPTBU